MEMHHGHHAHGGHESGHDSHSHAAMGHGMAVVGVDTIFMSHLPMISMKEHRFQVLTRVALSADASDPEAVYREDRAAHPEAKLYTFAPRAFVLATILPGENGEPPRSSSFEGSLVRNHFEEPPAHPEPAEEIASGVTVEVLDIVHVHGFDAHARRPEQIEYLLFGRGSERFVAHFISGAAPDFDQLVAVDVKGREFHDDDLRQAVVLTLPGRRDDPADRLREGEKDVACTALLEGEEVPLELDAGAELYVDTADLASA